MIKSVQIILLTMIIVFIVVIFGSSTQIDKVENLPQNKFILAIDVGHTKEKHGATSARGIGEFYFNQNIAILLYNEMIRRGFTGTFLINKDGASITLKERIQEVHEKKAHLLISIHHDSAQPHYLKSWIYEGQRYLYCDLFQGYSIFYSEKNVTFVKSLTLAHLIGSELRENTFIPTLHHAEQIKGESRELIDQEKGIYNADFALLSSTRIPSILLECGIIINRNEEILLTNSVYQRMLILSISQAIQNFYEQEWLTDAVLSRSKKTMSSSQ